MCRSRANAQVNLVVIVVQTLLFVLILQNLNITIQFVGYVGQVSRAIVASLEQVVEAVLTTERTLLLLKVYEVAHDYNSSK